MRTVEEINEMHIFEIADYIEVLVLNFNKSRSQSVKEAIDLEYFFYSRLYEEKSNQVDIYIISLFELNNKK